MLKHNNYINIQAWMVTDLNLKGNDLLVYAIIYGFSQTEGTYFTGSLQYLCEWTNSTKVGILKNISNLMNMGLIGKIESKPTNKYYVIKTVNRVNDEVNTVNSNSKQSIPNIIDNSKENTTNICTEDTYNKSKEFVNNVQEIIKYFNSVCSTNFRSNTVATRKLIKRHLNEGFTVDDFKKVIELKYLDWGKNPIRFSTGQMSNEYLRPSTLFGDKFESYVYEALARTSSESYTSTSSEVDTDVSNITF